MNLREYNQRMEALLADVHRLTRKQEAIHQRIDEIEEAAKALRFRYITEGDVL